MWNASFRAATPVGPVIDSVTADQDRVLIAAHPVASIATCPECGVISTQVHSRYERRLLDLPIAGPWYRGSCPRSPSASRIG
jgi:hypothetical protein